MPSDSLPPLEALWEGSGDTAEWTGLVAQLALRFFTGGAGNPARSRLSAGWTRWKARPQPEKAAPPLQTNYRPPNWKKIPPSLLVNILLNWLLQSRYALNSAR